jgi:hypothetical protein
MKASGFVLLASVINHWKEDIRNQIHAEHGVAKTVWIIRA